MSPRLEVNKTYKLYINGLFPRSESGRSILIKNDSGNVLAHVAHGSRKDLRDAVEAAAAAQPKWGSATAYNRGQVLYRMAEMLEGKRDEFAELLAQMPKSRKVEKSKRADTARERRPAKDVHREVEASIDRLVCFAGWADKYAQVLGCANPVAGPYYNFTIPEPTGVVGVVSPMELNSRGALLGWITLLAPPLCAGNAVVLIADGASMLPAAVFGEVCATSDVPPGVINIITGKHSELLDHLARHRNVNAISAANLDRESATVLRMGIAENLKRIHIATIQGDKWLDPAVCVGPAMIEPFVEFKTIWHPAAT
jgi:acyl-CoA reductase-like NAD-dependent aldehyde dehydrogenase